MSDNYDAHSDLEVIDLAAKVDPDGERSELVAPGEQAGTGGRLAGRRRWLLVGIVILAVLGMWAAVAASALLGIRDDVLAARTELFDGRGALEDGDLDLAAERFNGSADTLEGVPGRVSSPMIWPVLVVPQYRRTIDAVSALAEAGGLAAGAAARITDEVGSGDGGLGALTPRDGRIPLDVVERLAPVLQQASADMAEALTLVRSTPDFGVADDVIDARAEFLDLLGPAVSQLALGSEVANLLPALFGADGPRRYLVVASNPAEARGTGGFIGAFTIMEANDGQMSFGPVREAQDLPIPPAGTVPWPDSSLAERWDLYGGSGRIRSINMTPDFPAAAQTMESYWSVVLGEDLDGVISVDPFAFESLLSVSGPVEIGDFGVIPADEVVDFVTYSAYSLIEDPARRKRLIGDVATSSLQGFLAGPGEVSPAQLLGALGEMARRDSLLIHSVREREQEVLVETGLAGELSSGDGDMLAVIINSGSGSKIDYFLDRTLRYDVELQPDGSADAVVSAGFFNTAPTEGELTYMIGPPGPDVDFGAGDNVLYASVYCAPGCSFVEVPDLGYADLPTGEFVELGFPVASTWLLIPSMQGRQLIYSYQVPGAWAIDGEETVYSLRYIHQTSVRPTEVEIRVQVPEGLQATGLPDGARVVGDEVVIEVLATTDVDYQVRFGPS